MTLHHGPAGAARDRVAPAGRAPRVRFEGLTKQYPNGVRACQNVDIDIAPGSIHAIVGENGAGKSTLMKMLYGMEHPTSGSLVFDDDSVELRTPDDAIARGVGMVHQSFMLVPTFTLAQNVVLGAEPTRFGLVDKRRMTREVETLADTFRLPVRGAAKARDVSVGVLQRVEILKALYRGARVLVLDEPTAVLTPQETEELFRALRRFADSGRTVIFISHKLREVLAIADRITVMRAGRVVGETTPVETSERALATMMVGRDMVETVRIPSSGVGDELLSVTNLSCLSDLRQAACVDVTFAVRSGEILCCVGVEGNGQTELIEAIAGLRPATDGTVKLDGTDLTGKSVGERRRRGLSHIPEDRMKDGAALDESIEDNLIVDSFASFEYRRGPFQRTRRIRARAQAAITRFQIRAADSRVPVGALSGGNIQKVVIARELSNAPRVILAAQPTRGVDVGAMQFIYDEIRRARDTGAAVLIVSADLSEALALADRLVVMRNGRIVAEFSEVAELTEELVGLHMLGAFDNTNDPAREHVDPEKEPLA